MGLICTKDQASYPTADPRALSREWAGAGITAWQLTPGTSATIEGGDPTPRPLGEFGKQRGKAKTGSKVYFSKLREAGLRMRDLRSSLVALCKSEEALKSIRVFVVAPPS